MIVACGFEHAGVPLRERLLAVIADAGHAPNISNPQEFDRVMTEFLATVG